MDGMPLGDALAYAFVKWCGDIEQKTKAESTALAKESVSELSLAGITQSALDDFMLGLPDALNRARSTLGWFERKKHFPKTGIFLTQILAYTPLKEYTLKTSHLDQGPDGFRLDYLFTGFQLKKKPFGMSRPRVLIDGPLGNHNFELTSIEARVLGPVGDHTARGFKGGYLLLEAESRHYTAKDIQSGCVEIKKGGKNIAENGKGGIVKVYECSDRLGIQNNGAHIIAYDSVGAEAFKDMRSGTAELWCDAGPELGNGQSGGLISLKVPYSGRLPPENKTGGIIKAVQQHTF